MSLDAIELKLFSIELTAPAPMSANDSEEPLVKLYSKPVVIFAKKTLMLTQAATVPVSLEALKMNAKFIEPSFVPPMNGTLLGTSTVAEALMSRFPESSNAISALMTKIPSYRLSLTLAV